MKVSKTRALLISGSVILSILWILYSAVKTGISHDLKGATTFFFTGIVPLLGLGMIFWSVQGFMDNFYDE